MALRPHLSMRLLLSVLRGYCPIGLHDMRLIKYSIVCRGDLGACHVARMGYAMRHISQSEAERWQCHATARGMTLSVICLRCWGMLMRRNKTGG